MGDTVITDSLLESKKKYLEDSENNLAYLFPTFYQELKCLAHSQLKKAWSIETMQTTALLHETYLKLNESYPHIRVSNKQHFFCLCAKAMRHVLINYAEQKQTQKRGGDVVRVAYTEELYEPDMYTSHSLDTLLAINEVLEKLRKIDEKLTELVELRFFAGFTEAELAQIYHVSERTIRRHWKKAKALLVLTLES
ncbi:ECF-type sigma factor [Microbulbifer sp. 2304DJ12-6]|uniref:ECF-type sigma factor n=1 Tax=Microbulbifer sp. 2304DJ12-6 TaxID=3233340 RepID=UPI0039AF61A2